MGLLSFVRNALIPKSSGPVDPRLLRAMPPGSYAQTRDEETDPAWGWTVDRVVEVLKNFCDGDIQAGAEIQLAMMRDPVIAGCIETRAETGVQLDRWWEKPEACPQWVFDLWLQHWKTVLSSADLQEIHENRLMLGVTPTNETWAPEKTGRLFLPSVYTKDPGNLEWVKENAVRGYLFHAIEQTYYVDNDGQRFLLWSRKGRRPHMSGLIIPLAIVWITGQEALRQWPSRNKSHGKSWRLLEFPADQRESADVKALIKQAQTMLAGGVVPLPRYAKDLPSFDLRLLSENTDVSATFENLIRLADEYKRLLILGVEENTSGGSASDAKAKTQDRVFLRKVKSDAKRDIETLAILACCMCRVNGLPDEWAPIYCVDADPPSDENEEAQRQKDRADAAKSMAAVITAMDQRALTDSKAEKVDAVYMLEQVGVFTQRKAGAKERRDTY